MDTALCQACALSNTFCETLGIHFIIIIYPPKSSYSAPVPLREDGVRIPLHGADIVVLISGRKVLN